MTVASSSSSTKTGDYAKLDGLEMYYEVHGETNGRRPLVLLQEVRKPDFGSPRLPSEADFQEMTEAYTAVAPHPERFQDLLAKCRAAAHAPLPWTDGDLRGLPAPTLLVIGDADFVRIEHGAEMRRLIPDARLTVLPGTTHMSLMRRTAPLLPLLDEFLD
ncbi:alpha/beta fold hydrolase [Streptomyces sp. NPDC002671]